MDLSAARGSKQMAQSMEVSVKWEGTVFIVLPSGLSEGPDSRTALERTEFTRKSRIFW